jgi:hypothetical protein
VRRIQGKIMDRRDVEAREWASFVGGFMGGFITVGMVVIMLFVMTLMVKRGY